MSLIYNRENSQVYESVTYKSGALKFLYNNKVGRMALKVAVCPFVSKTYGKYNNSKISTRKIGKFIKDNEIDLSEYENKNYKSFNEFFTRKKANLSFDKNENSFISPADSKLTAYKITKDLSVNIKNSIYTINELLEDKLDYENYKDGSCLVFRLSVDDYHRYCFIDNGIVKRVKKIKGKLHTVSPISQEHKVYSQNSRVCSFIDTQNFGEIIYIEVGALMVGRIVNHNLTNFKKGQEKGYFEFGGSTIVILTDSSIKIDDDILEQSKKGIETQVYYGERIGEKIIRQ